MRCLTLASLLWCALASAGTAELTWDYPTHNVPGPTAGGTPLTDLADFLLYRRCGAGALELFATVPASTASPSGGETGAYTDVQPDDGRTCRYSIVARNALGEESVRTGEVSKTFIADAAPPGDVSATFTWTATPVEEPPDVGTSSIRVDASGEYIRRTANLPTEDAYTLAGWFRASTSNLSADRIVLALENATSSSSGWRSIGWVTSGDFKMFSSAAADQTFASAPPLDGTWFYAYIKGGGTTLRAGWRKLGDANWVSVSVTDPGDFTTAMASWLSDSWDQPGKGDVVYPRMWDAELTEEELHKEMLSTSPVRTSNLNHASVDDGVDTSGNSRDLTLNGTSAGADRNDFIYAGNIAIEGTQVQHNPGFPIYANTNTTDDYVAVSGDSFKWLHLYGRGSVSVEIGVWDITDYTGSRQNIAGADLVGSGTVTLGAANGYHAIAVDIPLTAGRTYAIGFNGAFSGFVYRSTTDAVDYSRSSATNLGALSSSADPFPTATGGTDRHYSVFGVIENSGGAAAASLPPINPAARQMAALLAF